MVRDKGREEGVFPSSVPPLSRQEEELALHSRPQGRVAHLHLPHPGPALLRCSGKVQGSISQVLQQVKGRDRSPSLVVLLGSSSSACDQRSRQKASFVEATTQQTRDRAGSPHEHSLIRNPHIVGQSYCADQMRCSVGSAECHSSEGQADTSPCWL